MVIKMNEFDFEKKDGQDTAEETVVPNAVDNEVKADIDVQPQTSASENEEKTFAETTAESVANDMGANSTCENPSSQQFVPPVNNYAQPPYQPFMPDARMQQSNDPNGYAPNNMGGAPVPPQGYMPNIPPMQGQGSFNTNYSPFFSAPNVFAQDVDSLNPIRYSTVSPMTDTSKEKKGLKLFCILMALVIVLTGGCLAGYFVGKDSKGGADLYSKVDVDLAAKPKDTDQSTAGEIYEKTAPSIVGIRVYNEKGQSGEASGVIYTKEGYVITNDHIYSEIGAPIFRVYTHDGKEYEAEYVGGDIVSDLAVLKIKNPKDLVPAQLGQSEEIFCGEQVVAISRNGGAASSSNITQGIISLTKRRVSNASNYSLNLIQTDTALNPGSSGGALVNMYSQIVGITVSKLSGVEYDRIGFAIPTTTVKWVVEQIIEHGKVTDRAKLGITYNMVDSVVADVNGFDAVGLYIGTVSEDSDLYGKVSEGDIITHINDIEIKNDDIVLDIIEKSRAGDVIKINVYTAKGKTVQYNVKLMTNMGTSSYSEEIVIEEDKNSSESYNDGTFDFPFGE